MAGGTGVLGRRLLPLLVAAGHTVTAVARTAEKAAAVTAAGAEPVTVDLFDPAAVARGLPERVGREPPAPVRGFRRPRPGRARRGGTSSGAGVDRLHLPRPGGCVDR
ncbi:MAG: NAD(P)H-binding protein [Actinomycetes bacterium]